MHGPARAAFGLGAILLLAVAHAWASGTVQPLFDPSAYLRKTDAASFATTAQLSAAVPTAAQIAAAAPVQSVNAQTGAVTVPAYKRQVTTSPLPVSTVDGTVTWSFPAAFTNMPSCYYSLAATTTTYTFDYPEVTAISLTAVTLQLTAHPKNLTIASLVLPITLQLTPATIPTGTTISFTCYAPI